LALPARELRGIVAGPAGDLDELEQLVDPLSDLRSWALSHLVLR